MDALVDFLLACFAEDEEAARATSGQPWSATVPRMVHADGGFRIKSRYVASVEHDEDRAHIARWNPARVLAECKAKRRIVKELAATRGLVVSLVPGGSGRLATLYGLDAALRALALPYADRPGYREEWRP